MHAKEKAPDRPEHRARGVICPPLNVYAGNPAAWVCAASCYAHARRARFCLPGHDYVEACSASSSSSSGSGRLSASACTASITAFASRSYA